MVGQLLMLEIILCGLQDLFVISERFRTLGTAPYPRIFIPAVEVVVKLIVSEVVIVGVVILVVILVKVLK